MAFDKRAVVIGYVIRLQNYCMETCLELSDELKRKGAFIEVLLGINRLTPKLSDSGRLTILQMINAVKKLESKSQRNFEI